MNNTSMPSSVARSGERRLREAEQALRAAGFAFEPVTACALEACAVCAARTLRSAA